MTRISMYQASVPRLANTLGNLSAMLDKAQAHVDAGKIDMATLMQRRLIDDMYPFYKQVQIACDKARSVVARLAGIEVPAYPDDEATLAELQQRIARTIEFIRSVKFHYRLAQQFLSRIAQYLTAARIHFDHRPLIVDQENPITSL